MLFLQYKILNFLINIIFIIFIFIIISIYLKKRKILYSLIILLYLLSLPITYKIPLYFLEKPFLDCHYQNKKIDLIIILGGGLNKKNNFNNKPTVKRRVLERIRYGTFIHKKYKIPILVSGGDVFNTGYNEADVMKNIIQKEYGATVKFVENKSKTTNENAKFVSKIIKHNNIDSILIVSNSWHLKRASMLFEKYNPNIQINACSGYYYSDKKNLLNYNDFIPSMNSFYFHNIVLRERIAIFWYRYINNLPSRKLY